jgi:hypothetical protein
MTAHSTHANYSGGLGGRGQAERVAPVRREARPRKQLLDRGVVERIGQLARGCHLQTDTDAQFLCIHKKCTHVAKK